MKGISLNISESIDYPVVREKTYTTDSGMVRFVGDRNGKRIDGLIERQGRLTPYGSLTRAGGREYARLYIYPSRIGFPSKGCVIFVSWQGAMTTRLRPPGMAGGRTMQDAIVEMAVEQRRSSCRVIVDLLREIATQLGSK